jgi:hypothetical protein
MCTFGRAPNNASKWEMGFNQSECVYVALGIQHAMGMRHTLICGLPRSAKFCYILSYTRYDLRTKVFEHKQYFWFLYIFV